MVVLMDGQDRGLSWHFTTEDRPDAGALDAGATMVFNTFFGYEGSSTKVYARASEFDDCRTCLVAQPIELTTPEGVARLCRAGLEAEVLKESRLAP
jgi:hypothetical protein